MHFLKKLFGFSLGPIIGALISFITVPLTTYFINPAEYGKTSLFTMVQSIIMVAIYLGMDQVFVREYHEETNKKKMITNCIILPLALSFILLILAPLYAQSLSKWMYGVINAQVIYIQILAIPFIVIERFIILSIRMEEKAFLYSTISIMTKIVVLFLTFIYIFFIRRDFLAIVYSTLFGQIISDFILLILFNKYIKIKLKYIDIKIIISYLKYGVPLALAAMVGYLLNSTDKIFLRYYSTYEQLGYYSVALKVTSLLSIIQTSFGAFWAPVALRWRHEGKNNYYFEMVNRLLSFFMALIFMAILTFKFLIPILISTSYKSSILIIPFLLLYPMMSILCTTTELGIQFTKKTYISVISTILSLLLNILLNYILVPKYAAIGASISTGLSYILFFWLRTLASRKLWFKFKINHLVCTTALLFFSCLFNTLIVNQVIIFALNIICVLLLLLIYQKELKYIIGLSIKYIKKYVVK